jgi:hypothetical protein
MKFLLYVDVIWLWDMLLFGFKLVGSEVAHTASWDREFGFV